MTSPEPLRSTARRGLLPLPNGTVPAPAHRPVVSTLGFVAAQTKISAVVNARRICALDGENGTGKSTVVGYYAAQAGRLCRLVTIPDDSTVKEALSYIHVQLTGHQPTGTKMDIRSDLYQLLSSDEYVVLLDEAQNLGVSGFKQVRNLWDVCNRMGRPFPLVIGGAGVMTTLAKVPDLADRVSVRHTMTRLGTDELIEVAKGLHPRLDVTPEALLFAVDQGYARGSLRRWDDFLTVLDTVYGPPEPGRSAQAVSRAQADRVLVTLGHPDVKL